MGELANLKSSRQGIRWRLLLTASGSALLASAIANARAEELRSPTIWIEVGGQLERSGGENGTISPPFMSSPPIFVTHMPAEIARLPRLSNGAQAKLTFAPRGADWVFAASLRYGRSNSRRHAHQSQYIHEPSAFLFNHYINLASQVINPANDYDDIAGSQKRNYAVIDFQAGRDVGLGLFHSQDNGIVSVGVRFAQFTSNSDIAIKARPDLQFYDVFPPRPIYIPFPKFHNYEFYGQTARSVHAIGPSISLEDHVRALGNLDVGELTFDWGANAAVLFGRQKAKLSHRTIGAYYHGSPGHILNGPPATQYEHEHADKRARAVAVPNAGGFVGASLRWTNVNLSLGYRADFFFGAIDGGVDARKAYDSSFYGPFVNMSIGLGG